MTVPDIFRFGESDVDINTHLARAMYLLNLQDGITNGQRRYYKRLLRAETQDIEYLLETKMGLQRHPIGEPVTSQACVLSLVQTEADLILRRQHGQPDIIEDEQAEPYRVNLLYNSVLYAEYEQTQSNGLPALFGDVFMSGMDADRAGKCAPLHEVTYLPLDGLRILNRESCDDTAFDSRW